MSAYQVAIVGGGPVGVALAVELCQRGVTCAVIERHREVGRIPKGQGLRHRSLEHFYFWNCVDELRAARLMPAGYPIGGLTAFGNLTSKYWHSANATRSTIGDYYFQRNERLPQYLTEQVLRTRAAALPSVTFLFERTAKAVEQDDSGARVTVTSEVWPYEDEVIEAEYVVGCDGARSMTREQLGIERHGTDLGDRMVLAVFASPELHEGLQRFGEKTTYHVVNPAKRGAWQFFGRVEVGRSWFYHGPVRADATPDDADYIRAQMEEAAGFPFAIDFEHIGFWNLRIDVADTYRKDRVFIAGDAAHSHPPYGGHGLKNGLEDVTNLGWKLDAKLKGWGGDALLESYSEERQPVFFETGEDIIAAGILREREWLEQHSPERDLAEFEKAWEDRVGGGDAALDVEPHYEGSPVVTGAPHATPGIHSHHSFAARAGHHLTPQMLSSGRNVFEELGNGFTLLALDADPAAVKELQDAALSLKVPLSVVEDRREDGREEYEARLVLVRPDQYVAWTDNDGFADRFATPEKLLRLVVGAV